MSMGTKCRGEEFIVLVISPRGDDASWGGSYGTLQEAQDEGAGFGPRNVLIVEMMLHRSVGSGRFWTWEGGDTGGWREHEPGSWAANHKARMCNVINCIMGKDGK